MGTTSMGDAARGTGALDAAVEAAVGAALALGEGWGGGTEATGVGGSAPQAIIASE
jgi:hypothetical protein